MLTTSRESIRQYGQVILNIILSRYRITPKKDLLAYIRYSLIPARSIGRYVDS